ncbi:hypothetical protein QZH41_005076 [Actinostola sp. cb2023]|nr:hypothetical protein QZH41_005076 [Actinostola sp. cb2023]
MFRGYKNPLYCGNSTALIYQYKPRENEDGREDPAQGVEFPKPFLVMTKARQAPGQRVIEDWERKNLGSYYIVLVCLYQ